jgi:hypothetical protein
LVHARPIRTRPAPRGIVAHKRGRLALRLGYGAAFLLALAAQAGAVTAGDSRQLVDLPPVMREHMLGNMRDHLAAMLEIQQALAAGDYSTAGRVAELRIGVSSLTSHGASHMAPFMPAAMQDIGTAMHHAASQFVACHAAFRAH